MVSISLQGVTKRFPPNSGYCDVDGLDIDIEANEFFCIVGPSNSGKTTTLRLIAGLEEPAAGTIEIDGRPVGDTAPHERDVSMQFENLALYPNKTGFENIAHPLEVKGATEAIRRERVNEWADKLGITHLLDRTPETFSGGEKQRVGVARALVADSAAYLLDEPLGGLDAKLRKELRIELKRLHNEIKQTFVMSTHNQEEAMSVADRMAVIDDGRVHQVGPPEELYDRPVNRFVAGFIGSPTMNFYPGQYDGDTLTLGDLTLEAAYDGLDDGNYTVGVRPHDLELTDDAGRGTFDGTVVVSEPQGAETVVDVAVNGTELRIVTRGSAGRELDSGHSVGVSLDHHDCYLIDPDDDRVVRCPDRET